MYDKSKYQRDDDSDTKFSKDKNKDRGAGRSDDTRFNVQDDNEIINEFTTIQIRHNFMRKVYAILLVQLVVTIAIMICFRYLPEICEYVTSDKVFWYCMVAAALVLVIVITCCDNIRHIFPINFILLSLFTLVESVLLGGMSCQYERDAFLMAVGITAIVCVSLSLFAIQTKYDFTIFRGILLVFTIILMVFGILCIFIRDRILLIVYSCLGVLVFSCYLVVDTQMIMTGKHTYSLAPNEYLLGALMLYIDIIHIFTHLLRLIGLMDA